MENRVVITGIGPVTRMGIGNDAFFAGLMNKERIMCPLPDSFNGHTYTYQTGWHVPMPELDLEAYGLPGMYKNMAGASSQMAMIGAVLALKDAGYQLSEAGKKLKVETLPQAAIVIGTGFNTIETALDSYCAHNGLSAGERKARYNRMTIPIMMNNAPAGWISVALGISGENYTVNAACASGTYAIGEAFRKIRHGDAELVLTGGVEALNEASGALVRGFDQLGTLTTHAQGLPNPFSKERSGFLLNEGAGCILVLESLDHARRRGAEIYAEIVDYVSNSDAYNIVQMEAGGEQVLALMDALSQGRRIDYINAHGTGTQLNDEVEARVIQQLFGNRDEQPLIGSTKSLLGHSIGASGALEAAVTAYAIKNGKIHGTLTEDVMDNLNVAVDTVDCSIRYALSMSYGFGGHNAGLLLGRYDE